MSRKEPVEKLPLAVRKNVRDEWTEKKADLEQELSGILGVEWTIDIDPNYIFAYAEEGSYGKNSLGSCIAAYIAGANYQLKYFADKYKEGGLEELNSICFAHVLTLDVDVDKKFSYCGVDINDGAMRILFGENYLGTNVDYAVQPDTLMAALNAAPPAPGSDATLSLNARTDIRDNWEPNAEELQKKIAGILQKDDIKLSPNFEDVFTVLKKSLDKKEGESGRAEDTFDSRIGYMMKAYFEAVAYQLEYQKFGEDEMLREGFLEAVESGEIAFRVVDELKHSSYNEAVVENGVLYLQTRPHHYGTNVDQILNGLLDRL